MGYPEREQLLASDRYGFTFSRCPLDPHLYPVFMGYQMGHRKITFTALWAPSQSEGGTARPDRQAGLWHEEILNIHK